MLLVYLVVPMSGLGLDLYAPSLPSIMHAMQASRNLVQLSLSVYILAFAIGQPLIGPITDTYGRKKILLCGLMLHLCTTLLIPFFANIHSLVGLRFLQGLSIAMCVVPMRAVVADIYKGKAFAKYFNRMSLAWSTGPIVAPWIGAHLQHWFFWQASFIFLACYSTTVIAIALLKMQEPHPFQGIHINVKRLVRDYLQIISHLEFVMRIVIGGLTFSIFYLFVMIAPFIIEHTLGHTPLVFGRMALTLGVGTFLGNSLNGYFLHTCSKLRSYTSISIMLCSMLLFFGLCQWHGISLTVLLIPNLIYVCALGMLSPIQATNAINLFPKRAGTANAVYFSGFWLIIALINYAGTFIDPKKIIAYATLNLAISVSTLVLYAAFIARHEPDI